jgi:hypothetical protein
MSKIVRQEHFEDNDRRYWFDSMLAQSPHNYVVHKLIMLDNVLCVQYGSDRDIKYYEVAAKPVQKAYELWLLNESMHRVLQT